MVTYYNIFFHLGLTFFLNFPAQSYDISQVIDSLPKQNIDYATWPMPSSPSSKFKNWVFYSLAVAFSYIRKQLLLLGFPCVVIKTGKFEFLCGKHCHCAISQIMPIYYAVVSRGLTILARCNDASCTGNFQEVTAQVLSQIPAKDSKLTYSHDSYLFHYVSEQGIIYMCITDDVIHFCSVRMIHGKCFL